MTRIELYIPTRWSAWGDNILLSLPLYIFIYVNSTKILSYSVIWYAIHIINNWMALLILIFLITNVLWYFLMEHIWYFLFVLGKLQIKVLSAMIFTTKYLIFNIKIMNMLISLISLSDVFGFVVILIRIILYMTSLSLCL